jgi:hypothetical protein
MPGLSSSEIVHADEGGKLLKQFNLRIMKNKALIWYGSALILLIITIIIFLKSLDWKAIVILVLGMAAVLLFRQGVAESKKKNDTN